MCYKYHFCYYMYHVSLLQGEQGFAGIKGEIGEKVNLSLHMCTRKDKLHS